MWCESDAKRGAMLVATFGPSTGWAGKTITHDDGVFTLEGVGPVTAVDLLEYDRQGHLEWAYDGLREWVQQTAGAAPVSQVAPPGVAATTKTPRTRRRKFPVWAIVVVALLGVFVVLAVIGALLPAEQTPENAGAPSLPVATATSSPAKAEATQTPAESADTHHFGQSQLIRAGSEALEITPLSLTISKRPPASVFPLQSGKGWVYAIVRVRFKNVGTKFTKSQVGMWSELTCEHNAEDTVTAEWMADTQGNAGKLELDPGQKMTWLVTFAVRKTAKVLSFSYTGPGDHQDTWLVD